MNKEVIGNIIGAILKYNRTRISMRDRLNRLLEEENAILRKKVELLFSNLKEYEEIIGDEWLNSVAENAKVPDLTTDLLTQLFYSPKADLKLAKAIGDFENTFSRDGATVTRNEEDALWMEKRHQTNKLPKTDGIFRRSDFIKKKPAPVSEAVEAYDGIVSRSNSGLPENDMPTVQKTIEACEKIEKEFEKKEQEEIEKMAVDFKRFNKKKITDNIDDYIKKEGLKDLTGLTNESLMKVIDNAIDKNLDMEEQFIKDVKEKTVDDFLNEELKEDKD